MPVKMGMSKAYDQMEWSFFKEILKALGFDDKLISWVMGVCNLCHMQFWLMVHYAWGGVLLVYTNDRLSNIYYASQKSKLQLRIYQITKIMVSCISQWMLEKLVFRRLNLQIIIKVIVIFARTSKNK